MKKMNSTNWQAGRISTRAMSETSVSAKAFDAVSHEKLLAKLAAGRLQHIR